MKTPREILLERHQTATPKLDAIRHEVVKEFREGRRAAVPKFRVAGTATLPILLWRELIWPCRRIWTGMAAIWLAILVVNVSQRDNSQVATRQSSPSPEMMMTFQQQERLLAELTEPRETRVTEPPKKSIPQPRSERRDEISMA